MKSKPQNDRERFKFPFEPYQIQIDFMKNLYDVIDKGCVGIFESPTGTVHFTSKHVIHQRENL